MFVCFYASVCIHSCVCVCVCAYVYVYVCVRVFLYRCMFARECVRVIVFVCMRVLTVCMWGVYLLKAGIFLLVCIVIRAKC